MVNAAQPIVLPSITVTWDTAVVTGTFIQYNVYRRVAGDADWTRIATISDESTLQYVDYTPAPRTVYEYAVTQSETIGSDVLESAKPDPVLGVVDFNWAYIHQVADPTQYVVFFSLEAQEDIQQEVQFRGAWGRQAPTAFIGELDYSTLRLSGLPDVIRGSVWEARTLASLQRSDAAVYCLRMGIEAKRYFVNIAALSRRIGVKDYAPEMSVSEVAYEEAV